MARGAALVVYLGGRNLAKTVRSPMLLAVSLVQPIAWLVLFSQTFRSLAGTSAFARLGYHSYLGFFAPGMVVLTVLFAALQSGMATVTDIGTGMMDKFATSPIPRVTVLAGRVWADAITMLVQAVAVLVIAVAMGARFATGLPGALLLLAFTTAFGVVWASVSNLIALRSRNAELTMALGFFLTLPVLFLSPAFFPLSLQPGWLQAIARANPAAYVIEAGQDLMNTGNSAPQDLRTLAALGIAAILLVPPAVAAYRRTR